MYDRTGPMTIVRRMILVLTLAILLSPRALGQPISLFGDFDADGELTICDSVELLACLSGPSNEAASGDCIDAFDSDEDEDVDLHDAAQLQLQFEPAPRLVDLPDRYDVMEPAVRVVRHWIDGNPNPGYAGWDRSTCFEGIVGFYRQLAEPELYDYSLLWAETNGWSLLGGPGTRNADNQAAGQVYLALYEQDPQPARIAQIQASVDAMVASTRDDDWWWIDAIHMALPVFAAFGKLYDDPAYYEKGWDLFHHTYAVQGDQGLYADNGDHMLGAFLWWRDQYFQPPATSPNGRQVFWSRGNGWVFAGLVRALGHMQPGDPHYADYVRVFQEMAASLRERQAASGFWPVNLDDPEHARTVNPEFVDCPETSGTAFFTYGMAWGIRHGLLDPGEYGPTVVAAWDALVAQSVDANGRLGWCQSVGVGPESAQPFDRFRTTDFCIGAFLLAASEVAQLGCGPMPLPGEISVPFSEGWWGHRRFNEGNHDLGPDNTGQVTAEFDIVPYSTLGLDGVVAYADASTDVSQYGQNFALVRLYGDVFDAYDFDRYRADVTLPFVPGASHHVRVEINLPARRYDVWVTPPNGAPVQLANDYRFRATAGFPDDLGQVTLISAINAGDFVVFNHTVRSR